MKINLKKILMLILLCLATILIYRLIFSYTIISWGNRYKHKISSVERFPHCYVNPFYYNDLKNSIQDFLNKDFKKYYQKEYSNTISLSTRYFKDMDKGFKNVKLEITSIRETDKKEIMEILVFQNHNTFNSVIFIFNRETKKVIGFY